LTITRSSRHRVHVRASQTQSARSAVVQHRATTNRAPQNGELVPEHEVLERDVAPRSERCHDRPEHRRDDGEHPDNIAMQLAAIKHRRLD
jgi:hypothetical protein